MILRLRQGVPSATVPASAHAEPSLAHTLLGSHLPRLLATLTPIAVCNLLAAIPAGTGAIGAAVEAIKTVVCGALVGDERSEAVVAV